MSFRPRSGPVRDTYRTSTRGRSADKYLAKGIGPFSGKPVGERPRRKLQIADPPAPAPKKRRVKPQVR